MPGSRIIFKNLNLSEYLWCVLNVSDVGGEAVEVIPFPIRPVNDEAGQKGGHQMAKLKKSIITLHKEPLNKPLNKGPLDKETLKQGAFE